MDYTARHKAIRSRGASLYYDEEERKREAAKQGLTKEEYWEKSVHTRDDVVRYYNLYYPEYPDVLAQALATKLTQILHEVESDPLVEASYAEKVREKREKALGERPDPEFVDLFAKTLSRTHIFD